jgi:integrase
MHGTGKDGLLFQGRVQELPSQHTVRISFMKAAEIAGLPPEFTPHDLRHCFASVALSRGVPITDVSRWLGHRSVDLTYRTYSHFLPDAFDRARELLDAEFSDLS